MEDYTFYTILMLLVASLVALTLTLLDYYFEQNVKLYRDTAIFGKGKNQLMVKRTAEGLLFARIRNNEIVKEIYVNSIF